MEKVGVKMESGWFFTQEEIVEEVSKKFKEYNLSNGETGSLFNKLLGHKCQVGIVGGFIRDAFFGYDFKDLDIVVDVGTKRTLKDLLSGDYRFKTNAYFEDGFKLQLDGIDIDIWNVRKMGPIRDDWVDYWDLIEDYPKAVNYSTDGAIIKVKSDYYAPTLSEHPKDYSLIKMINSFRFGKINIVNEPHIIRSLKKAWTLKHKYHLDFGEDLKECLAEKEFHY